jgi:RNA polymerase sigma-70 factor (ECF subfamily)
MSVARGETVGNRDGSAVRGEAVRGEPVAAVAALVSAAYDDYAPALRAYALRCLRDAATADDVVQDAFLRLLAESAAGRAPALPRPWLFRVVSNLVVTRARHDSVVARRAGDLLDRALAPSPEDLLVERESAALLDARLDGLPAHARTAMVLAAHGYSGAEIALRIGRSELATRSLLCRQRRRLRSLSRPAA